MPNDRSLVEQMSLIAPDNVILRYLFPLQSGSPLSSARTACTPPLRSARPWPRSGRLPGRFFREACQAFGELFMQGEHSLHQEGHAVVAGDGGGVGEIDGANQNDFSSLYIL